MTQSLRARSPQSDLLKEGNEAFLAGRFNLAANHFEKAHRAEPRNPVPLFNLASAKERLGEIDEAAVHLTRALRLRSNWLDPARRLASLARRYVLAAPAQLDPHGLLTAFAFDEIDHEPLAATAMAYLCATTMLGGAVHQAGLGNGREAARALLLKRTDKTLSHPLLHAALTRGVNRDLAVEKLLTAMRAVLILELGPKRYEDKALLGFACALLQQCFNNGHVWPRGNAEALQLEAHPVDWDALNAGSVDAAKRLLWQLLYRGPETVIAGRLTSQDCRKLRPRGFADVLAGRLKEDEALSVSAGTLPTIGEIGDAVSLRVGRHYHDNPYPRWKSLAAPPKQSARRRLERYFSPERLNFLDSPFKVLVAGCGTGRHAVAAALRYGENADVLGVDLSRNSLAYGAVRAEAFGAANLRFARADLLTMDGKAGLFDIIEATGVLHHLAEPFAGVRALSRMLRQGGLMLIGLYSGIARRNIAALRAAPDYPGPDCDDDAARGYRGRLLEAEGQELLTRSHDFFTLSEFRDLALHPHEEGLDLAAIDAQLGRAGLIFRGFILPPTVEAQFTAAYPDDPWPGTLANWAAFEAQHPRTFDAMYNFWCEKG
jgi:SAM-dependent methyltransferase